MILGLGVDLCPVERMERIVGRHGDLFCRRVFTEDERDYAERGARPGERLAARFAAKEATIKALGGPAGLRWTDMEVLKGRGGAPSLSLKGKAREIADAIGVVRSFLSLTHAGGVAVAVVVLEGEADVE